MPSTITKEERATLRDKWTAHYNRTSDPYSGDALRVLDALETAEASADSVTAQRNAFIRMIDFWCVDDEETAEGWIVRATDPGAPWNEVPS